MIREMFKEKGEKEKAIAIEIWLVRISDEIHP
jgi:hypothetical protein